MIKKHLSDNSSVSNRSFRYSKRELGIKNTFTHNEIVNLTDELDKKPNLSQDNELEKIRLEVIEILAKKLIENN